MYVFSLVVEQVYENFQVSSFPMVVLIKDKEVIFSFVGYNREKATEAISKLSLLLGKGRFAKKLKI